MRIKSLSLYGEKGKELQKKWEDMKKDDPAFSPSDCLKWVYSLTALQNLVRNKIGMNEEIELIASKIPDVDELAEYCTPAALEILDNDPVMKHLKNYIVIKKAQPKVGQGALPLPLRLPLAPLNAIRKELSIPFPGDAARE